MSHSITTRHGYANDTDLVNHVLGRAASSPLERRPLPYLGVASLVGAAGAATVAAFALALDWLGGAPLATPNILGAKLFLGESLTTDAPIRLGIVFGYTLVHLAAFVIAGAAAVSAQHVLTERRVPLKTQLVSTTLIMFLGLELLFATLTGLVGGLGTVEFGFMRVAAGNALAAVTMGALLYVRGRALTAAR